jgi:hypothetical protein
MSCRVRSSQGRPGAWDVLREVVCWESGRSAVSLAISETTE